METVTAKWRVLETTGQQITITLRLHYDNTSAKIETFFKFLCGKKVKLIDHVTSEQGIKDHGSTHISSLSVLQSVIIMDPVRRLQLGRVLIQLDDQQNIVALKHQHQQVIRQRRLRRQ